ncbi:hypothetical protein [Streptosporangium sp. CA-115845]|uniref:hypothetical protein n=1 Tax=Streptosporangium sp. CA-115845 TaxID=3240071 RepID=UPI003D8DCF24
MYAYLLHGLVVKVAERFYGDWAQTLPGVTVVALLGVGFAALLCTEPVRRVTRWAVEPRMSWAFTRLRKPGRPRQRCSSATAR